MNGKIAVALDGPSGAGKSSLAKAAAEHFHFLYVDTGAIYRTVGLAAFRAGIPCKDTEQITALLPALDIRITYGEDGTQCMLLNGENVSESIRLPEISRCASDVSSLPEVRNYLLSMQRKFAETDNVIMDGRDIGTVVLPRAEVKIFLTASPEARARRRMKQLEEKGIHSTMEEVLQEIQYRDLQDSTRQTCPLRRAEDAVLLDTSELTLQESFEAICSLIRKAL